MGRHRPELTDTGYRPRYEGPFEFRHAAPKKGKRKVRAPFWAKVCLFFGVFLLLLSSSTYGTQWFLSGRYLGEVRNDDLLGSNRSGPPKVDGPLTFLLLGTDKRTEADYDPNDPSSHTWVSQGERADTIMLVHVPEDMNDAYVISIPRDSLVYIPESEDGDFGGGNGKINSAYYYGGAPLMVSTVNHLLGISVDYPIIVSFQAVRKLTDAVGGVDVVVDETTQDFRTLEIFKAGKQHLNGKRAEAYVRQRHVVRPEYMPITDPDEKTDGMKDSLPRGDYDRQARQQQFVHALTEKLESGGFLSNLSKADKLIQAVEKNVVVDQSMPIKSLIFSLKHLRPGNVTYLEFPVAGHFDPQDYSEYLNEPKVVELGEAIVGGTMQKFVQENPELLSDISSGP